MLKKKRGKVEYTDSREIAKRRRLATKDNVFNRQEFNFLHDVLLKGQGVSEVFKSLKKKRGVCLTKVEKIYVQRAYVGHVIEGGFRSDVSDNVFSKLIGRKRGYYGK